MDFRQNENSDVGVTTHVYVTHRVADRPIVTARSRGRAAGDAGSAAKDSDLVGGVDGGDELGGDVLDDDVGVI